MSCLLVRPDAVRGQPWSAEIHLRFPVAHVHVMIHKFHLPFRIVTGHKLGVTSYADGSGGPFSRPARLRRARSPVRTSPLASELLPTAKHFHSRARLRRLLVRLRRPTPQRSLRSLRRRGFALYVRLRHYRSSLFCCRKIIPSHSFAALTALIVRRVNGNSALSVRRVKGHLAYYTV